METPWENQMSWATALRCVVHTPCPKPKIAICQIWEVFGSSHTKSQPILLGEMATFAKSVFLPFYLKSPKTSKIAPKLTWLLTRATCATHTTNVHPDLPSTTAVRWLSKGWRSSTEKVAAEIELRMLMYVSQTSFQLLAVRCSLEVFFLATLLDLALMGNILSSQVKCYVLLIKDSWSFIQATPPVADMSSSKWTIVWTVHSTWGKWWRSDIRSVQNFLIRPPE